MIWYMWIACSVHLIGIVSMVSFAEHVSTTRHLIQIWRLYKRTATILDAHKKIELVSFSCSKIATKYDFQI